MQILISTLDLTRFDKREIGTQSFDHLTTTTTTKLCDFIVFLTFFVPHCRRRVHDVKPLPDLFGRVRHSDRVGPPSSPTVLVHKKVYEGLEVVSEATLVFLFGKGAGWRNREAGGDLKQNVFM